METKMNRIASFLLFTWVCLLSTGLVFADPIKDYNLGVDAYAAKQYEKALQHYLAACDAKLPEACHMAAGIYSQGQGVPANPDKAFHYLRLACDGKHAAACLNVAVFYMRGDGVKADGREAFRHFNRACDLNDADGCFNVGMAYENRVGVTYQEFDKEKMRTAFLKACDLKHGEACLKACFPSDCNDMVKAELAKRSCDNGHGDGCGQLGHMYYSGGHFDKDIRRGFELSERGCDLGSGESCGWLAWQYMEGGRGVTRDVGRALTLYRKACSLGEADDCMRLGKFYESGKHVKADPAEVVGLYKRACELERNYGEGCYNLARHLVEGKGIERDMPLAIKLFDGACWSGDLPWSCNDLGLLYLNGKGVAKDLDQAEQFFNEACNLEKWKRPHAGYNEGCKNEKRLKRQRDSEP
jgi:TPR repeat protein